MKRILILGGSGMMGHMLHNFLEKEGFDVYITLRKNIAKSSQLTLDLGKDYSRIEEIIDQVKPEFVVNCIGALVNFSNSNPDLAILTNGFFPHYLARLSLNYPFKLIHISTDCVFNGKDGPYDENSIKSEANFYGLSKNIGEVTTNENVLTIRTSIIGPEITHHGTGLFDWFINQESEEVSGYSKVIWSGLTTLELSKFIKNIIENEKFYNGLFHATNNAAISKFELLCLIRDQFAKDVFIQKLEHKISNKQLLSNLMPYSYVFPSYERMISELYDWIISNEKLYEKFYPAVFPNKRDS